MTDFPPPRDEPASDAGHESSVRGDDLLPPVEPPSAGFILQLFVVPALIVMLVVAVWGAFGWLVHRTTMEPKELISGLQGSSVARWQRASELADLLRNEQYAGLKDDAESAAQLATILDREIDAAADDAKGMQQEAVMLRYFLCRALGEFHVEEGLDVLAKAAVTGRDPHEQVVRRGAVEAIAVRAFNLTLADRPRSLAGSEVESTLLGLASDADEQVRSAAAYALGQIDTPACTARLEEMVDDPHADTRYNAALALAGRGNVRAVATLAEMLDPDELAGVQQEVDAPAQFSKRALVMTGALEAAEKLARRIPDADLSPIAAALARLTAADAVELERARIHPPIARRARETLDLLEER